MIQKNKLLICCALLGSGASLFGVSVNKTAFNSDGIHIDGPNGRSDYYGSGNDDSNGEYGIAAWNFSSTDFGGAISSISSMDLTLTFNDRGFSDGTSFEIWLSFNEFAGDYSSLYYDDLISNGLDTSIFTNTPESLGTTLLGFDSTDSANGGMQFNYNLGLTPLLETALVNRINNGQEFQLIITAVNSEDDITFSGVGNTYDPGDPYLTIAAAVPEPGAYAALAGMAMLGVAYMRRRRS